MFITFNGDAVNLRTALQVKDNNTDWFWGLREDEHNNKVVALHVASEKAHLECAEMLLNSGADINVKCYNCDETPLHISSRQGHTEIVALLIERGANINALSSDKYYLYDDYYCTAISIAAYFNNLHVVAMLYCEGAEDVNEALKAAAHGGSLDSLIFLLGVGADVSFVGSDRLTPLLQACCHARTDCVRELILQDCYKFFIKSLQ